MSCSKIDDLEDLAADLFDFDEEKPKVVKKERALKKHKKVRKVEAPANEAEED